MNVKFLSSAEKKEILEKLEAQYGISKLNYLLFQIGRDKVRAYSGIFSRTELTKLGVNANVEIIGIYLFKIEKDGIRLGHDAVSLLKDKITKNILEIDNEQAKKWFKGEDLIIEADKGYLILKNSSLLIGCGKSTGAKILNFVPKERRIKT